MNAFSHIAVVGAGAWGTALAGVAARTGHRVTLWAREAQVVTSINETHENAEFLAGIPIPDGITATLNMADLAGAQAVLMVAPAQHVRTVLSELAPHIDPGTPILLCSKGIEQTSGKALTDVLAETIPVATPAVLSGPSFAADVARGLPTAVTLACEDPALGTALADAIGLPSFRIYLSDDLIGAEIGGAVKNVLAIACGIVEGRSLGDSARAALIARGFAEMQRLALALGGKGETLAGLSGLGDLILTCTSSQSRNNSLGAALGKGEKLADVLGRRNTVAEGVHTAAAVVALAKKHKLDMPIARAVNAIVQGETSVDDAIISLISRPQKEESR